MPLEPGPLAVIHGAFSTRAEVLDENGDRTGDR